MRCLTLARKLIEARTEVFFLSSIPENSWIQKELIKHKIQLYEVEPNSFDSNLYKMLKLDLLIVDSYEIDVDLINEYSSKSPLMALIDGSSRGINANIYLDQNLDAKFNYENIKESNSIYLLGSEFCLIREELLELKNYQIQTPKSLSEATITCFSGGSDPNSVILPMAKIVAKLIGVESTFIASREQFSELEKILGRSKFNLVEFGSGLLEAIKRTTATFSAAGTSSWELMTLGIPSAFTITAPNQLASSKAILKNGVGLFLGDSQDLLNNLAENSQKLEMLLLDHKLRSEIYENCLNHFDGKGSIRVTEKIFEIFNK